MRLIALDSSSIELMKLSKKLAKVKTQSDKDTIARQISFYTKKIKENEAYFERM